MAWSRGAKHVAEIRLIDVRRVSTTEQARDDGSGLDRQAESNRRTAERFNATLLEPPIIITDVNRKNFRDTPEWRKQIRALIQQPDVHIVVDMLDRIVAGFQGMSILEECERTGTLIFHAQGVTDLATQAGKYVGVMSAVTAGNEVDSIRHRAKGGKEEARRKGLLATGAIVLPIGISFERIGRGRQTKAGRWVYTDRIETVREVYRLVTDDGVRNWREIARRTSLKNAVTVRNMLCNPIYKGWWILDEKRADGPTPIKADGRRMDRKKVKRATEDVMRHQVYRPKGVVPEPGDERLEAIVDEATWDYVQTILDEKTREFYRPREPKGNTRFVYTGRIWCAECHGLMWSRTRPPGPRARTRRDWYACSSIQKAGNPCPTKYLDRGVVNAGLDRLLTDFFGDPEFIEKFVRVDADGDPLDHSKGIAAAKVRLRDAEKQRGRLLDLYMAGSWPVAEMEARRIKLDAERDKLEREVRQLERAQAVADRTIVMDGLKADLASMNDYEYWSPEQKRGWLARHFPRVEVSKRGVERITWLPPSSREFDDGLVEMERDLPVTLGVEMTWEELVPKPELNDLGLVDKPFYTRRDVMQLLGLTNAMFVARLASGVIPAPEGRQRVHRVWTLDELRAMKAIQNPGEWGLPNKPLYTTGELSQVLGLSWDRIRRYIQRGVLPESKSRDANGHRVWTKAEMRAAVEAIQALASASVPAQ